MTIIGPLGFIVIVFGAVSAVMVKFHPAHARPLEAVAGFMIIGGLALLGASLLMPCRAPANLTHATVSVPDPPLPVKKTHFDGDRREE